MTIIASPAMRNTNAMPRASPSPSSHAHVRSPGPLMYGMITNSAIGAIRNAVMGAAAASNADANPNTRPCVRNGTTFWMTVCSEASTAGMMVMYSQMPAA